LHGKKILRLDYWSDYLGYVDIDVLMEKNLWIANLIPRIQKDSFFMNRKK
jgi:hypothetical protein